MSGKSTQISLLRKPGEPAIETVERKGIGHPDTICDALAENLSRNLCRYYAEHFGEVFHHNVDKALLCAGTSEPRFGGGRVVAPMQIILAGRATGEVAGKQVPVDEIAIEGSRQWLREHMHSLDPVRHVQIECRIHHGSGELVGMFQAAKGRVPLANDTSFGVGYAPMSSLEQLTLALDRQRDKRPEWGEDTKIMGVAQGGQMRFTVACAMVDGHLNSIDDYIGAVDSLQAHLVQLCTDSGLSAPDVSVNTADDIASGRVFLTVTGTSAEAGDDGQVGRGNRINGLITPQRPMSLEAVAGKNPVSHVGKLYNVTATRLAAALVEELDDVLEAQCTLVSRIGHPITEPQLVDVRVSLAPDATQAPLQDAINQIVRDQLGRLTGLSDAFIAGSISVY